MSQHPKQNSLVCKLAIVLGFSVLGSALVNAQTNSMAANYTGIVVTPSCTIAGGMTIKVPLKNIRIKDALDVPIDTEIPSSKTDVDVKLTGCYPNRAVGIKFEGTSSGAFHYRLMIPEVTGGAKGFAIAPRFNEAWISPNTTKTLTATADGSLDFKLGGTLVRTTENASELVAGTVAASMTLTFMPQ